eukprot:10530936-Lingulodinium_polyedra.AAC.1
MVAGAGQAGGLKRNANVTAKTSGPGGRRRARRQGEPGRRGKPAAAWYCALSCAVAVLAGLCLRCGCAV